jgi:hypothetical protein
VVGALRSKGIRALLSLAWWRRVGVRVATDPHSISLGAWAALFGVVYRLVRAVLRPSAVIPRAAIAGAVAGSVSILALTPCEGSHLDPTALSLHALVRAIEAVARQSWQGLEAAAESVSESARGSGRFSATSGQRSDRHSDTAGSGEAGGAQADDSMQPASTAPTSWWLTRAVAGLPAMLLRHADAAVFVASCTVIMYSW